MRAANSRRDRPRRPDGCASRRSPGSPHGRRGQPVGRRRERGRPGRPSRSARRRSRSPRREERRAGPHPGSGSLVTSSPIPVISVLLMSAFSQAPRIASASSGARHRPSTWRRSSTTVRPSTTTVSTSAAVAASIDLRPAHSPPYGPCRGAPRPDRLARPTRGGRRPASRAACRARSARPAARPARTGPARRWTAVRPSRAPAPPRAGRRRRAGRCPAHSGRPRRRARAPGRCRRRDRARWSGRSSGRAPPSSGDVAGARCVACTRWCRGPSTPASSSSAVGVRP